MKYILCIIVTLLYPLLCFAETIYTETDNKGNMSYSDTPLKNSKLTEIPKVDSTPSSPPSIQTTLPTPPTSLNPSEDKKIYMAFSISSPSDQETFQNQRAIPVTIKIEPALQKGDKIQLYVDGTAYGNTAESTSFITGQLERGSHTLSAALIDKNQVTTKQTNTITIYVQYARLGTGK
jgi:hypothetical protein